MTKKICISGYYGFNNFGDETILKILINNLKSFDINPDITVFSSNPDNTSKIHNVKSVQTFDMVNVIKALKNCDCLISGGGSLLQDVTSIKSLIYYLTVLACAQFFRKKTIIFAQGIGPINNKYLQKITSAILKKTSFISVRDDKSLELLDKWEIKAIKTPDPVWNIPLVNIQKTNKIGVQLRSSKNLSEETVKNLANCINKYFPGREIILMALQNEQDLPVLEKLKPYLNNSVIYENTSNEKIIQDIASLDTLIAMRYHACLAAIKNNVKLLPLSYDIKVENLAKDFSLEYINLNNPSNTDEIFNKFIKSTINYKKYEEYDFNILKNVLN